MALKNEFEYDGFHFWKVGTVPQNIDFDAFYETNSPADAHIISSVEINPYFAENFLDAYYKATGAPEEESLVFACMETGGRWVLIDSGYDSWLEEYNGPVVTTITSDERYEMLQKIWQGKADEVPKDIFICNEAVADDWLVIDNLKGEFSIVEFILKEDLDEWMKTGTLPSNYWCVDVMYPSDPSLTDFQIGVGKNRYVTVECNIHEGFYVMDNPDGGWVYDKDGFPDESYHFCEDAVINLAKREFKERFPPESEKKQLTSRIRR